MMKRLGTVLRSSVLAPLVFATLADCQGGSFGWLPNTGDTPVTCNSGSVALTSANITNYVGCMDLGYSATQQPFSLINNNTVVTLGTGAYFPPFKVTNYGATSFPGMPVYGNSTWTTMETAWNCSISCRAHGLKYSMFVYSNCSCSPYLPPLGFFYHNSQADSIYFYPTYATGTACNYALFGPFYGLYGDNTQFYIGSEASGPTTWSGNDYANASYRGSTASAVWVDTTFASDTTLVLATQATLYQYLACFIMSTSSTTFMPLGFINNFTFPSQCYTFCAGVNMPYAGMAYQGGS